MQTKSTDRLRLDRSVELISVFSSFTAVYLYLLLDICIWNLLAPGSKMFMTREKRSGKTNIIQIEAALSIVSQRSRLGSSDARTKPIPGSLAKPYASWNAFVEARRDNFGAMVH